MPSEPELRHQEVRPTHVVSMQSLGTDEEQRICKSLHVMQVFAVSLNRKPLFPGTMMPVQIHDQQLINEVVELKRDKYGFHLNYCKQPHKSSCMSTASVQRAVCTGSFIKEGEVG